MFRNSKPIFFENSWVPRVLSCIAPIEIGAITLGFFVFSKEKLSKRTKNHETIHLQQYIELFFIGFIFLYLFYWIFGLLKYRDGKVAYHMIPFEQEAYANDLDARYPRARKRYSWLKYKL